MLFMGCDAFWKPSDKEVLELVRIYYSFTRRGIVENAEILERGKFVKECKCYPIKFQITLQDSSSFKKIFYFFKNEEGKVDISEFQYDLR